MLQTRIDATKALPAARYLMAKATTRDDHQAAIGWIGARGWRGTDALAELVTRSGVSAADDADLRGRNPVLTDLAGEVKRLSILGNLPGVVHVPFNAATIAFGSAVRAYWAGHGKAIPMSPVTLGEPQLLDTKTIGALLVARDEFLREAGPLAERALSEELIRATVEAFDAALLDLANDGTTGDAPESVTHTGYSTASTGSSLAQVDTDLTGLVEELASEDLSTARWCLHPRTACYLAALRGTGGNPAFPNLGVNGGSLLGIPALVSAGVPMTDDTAATTQVSLLIGSGVVLAGGEVELRTSKQATIEMDTEPTGNTATPVAASANAVSMFQSNSTALMVIGHANWRARRATVAATLTGVSY